MAFRNGPNKTVEAFRRKHPFPPREQRPICTFSKWILEKARQGAMFNSIEEAREAFKAETGNEPD